MVQFSQFAAVTLTNRSLTITGYEGFKAIAFVVTPASTASAILTGGNFSIGGVAGGSIAVQQGEGFSFSVGNGDDIDGITINAPLGCTVKLVASRSSVDKHSLLNMALQSAVQSGSGGATYPTVNTYAELPDPTTAAGRIYVVLTSTGIYLINRKEAGMWYSDGVAWTRLGNIASYFSDMNFQIYNNTDTSKVGRFNSAPITSGQIRTLDFPDKDGTIALLSDIGSSTIADQTDVEQATPTENTKATSSLRAWQGFLYWLQNSTVSDLNTTSKFTVGAINELKTAIDSPIKTDYTPQNTALTHLKGRVYYDNLEDALTYFNSISGLSNQIGREIWVRVRNITGSTISNGKAVYIIGANNGIATIELADCKYYTKSRIIGIATHDIVSDANGFGYVTFIGRVNDVVTTGIATGSVIFLKEGFAGDFTTDAPMGGCYKVRLGIVVVGNSANGAIEVNTSASEYSVETVKETGFPDRSQLSFNFVNATRTFTIQPSGTEFRYYQTGEKYIKTALETLVISDVEGSHFIYYNGTTLAELVNGTTAQVLSIIRNYATLYYIDWDKDNQRENTEFSEYHWSKDYGIENHVKDHLTQGALYANDGGLTPNTINTGGNGSLDSHAQFGITAGAIWDEDIYHSLTAVLPTVGCERIYYQNALSRPRYATNVGFSVLTTGTGRLAYNPAGSALVEVTNNNYVWYHVFGSPHRVASRTISAYVGKSQYTSTANAYAGALADSTAVQLSGLPSPEYKLIASILFQTSNTYANAVKARTRPANTTGDPYLDWRKATVPTGGAVAGGGGGITTPVFSDADFKIFDNGNITTELQFEVSGLPAATLSTVSFDSGGTVAVKPTTATEGNIPKFGDNRELIDSGIKYINEIKQTLTSNTTITSTGIYLIDATSNNITIILPSVTAANIALILKRIDNSSNTVTINTISSQTIDSYTSLTLDYQYSLYKLISNGTSFNIIGVI